MVKKTTTKKEDKKDEIKEEKTPAQKTAVKKEASAKTKVEKKSAAADKTKKEIKPAAKAKGKKEKKGLKDTSTKKKPPLKKKRYYETVGRRKTSIARIRLWTAHPSESAESGGFIVNDKKHTEYFSSPEVVQVSEESLRKMKSFNRFRISVKVNGGGIMSQAEAIRHGVARALVDFDINFRKKLKRSGYLVRDPRMRERKKYGLKRARRAPQWVKR